MPVFGCLPGGNSAQKAGSTAAPAACAPQARRLVVAAHANNNPATVACAHVGCSGCATVRYIKSTKDEPRINAGLLAIDALIDVAAREDRVQLKLFANAITHISCYYRFSENSVLLAARTIAHLLEAADNLLATFVEHEARRAVECVKLQIRPWSTPPVGVFRKSWTC